jgi:O-6-methylguanine DNA methyltransferase
MAFPDASGVPVNMLPISDGSAFDQLKLLVDREDDNLAGPDWLGMLAAIGIVKGQPFTPDAHTREILDRAAKTAYETSRVIGFEEVVGGLSYMVYSYMVYPDRHWTNPFADGTPAKPSGALNLSWINTAGGYLALDARINFFTNYYSLSPGMFSYTSGRGANYLIAFTVRDIPPGSTASYAGIAERIGTPKAVRAVAGACAANKIAVAIPCHRIVRTDGTLSGYRWGVERKRNLLDRETKS